MTRENTMYTIVPGRAPIALKEWYPEFEWYYPNCELATKKWFVDNIQPDWVIIDCGANIGYYTILFSQLAPRGVVYAVEPTETIAMLEENLRFNNVSNAHVFKVAMGKSSGRMEEGIYRIWGKEPERAVYEFTTLDDFVGKRGMERVDCIKIDVDSFDFEALQGAEQTLKRHDPFVVVELNHALSRRNQSNMQALEWMRDLGYQEAVCLEYENFVFKRSARHTCARSMTISFGS